MEGYAPGEASSMAGVGGVTLPTVFFFFFFFFLGGGGVHLQENLQKLTPISCNLRCSEIIFLSYL